MTEKLFPVTLIRNYVPADKFEPVSMVASKFPGVIPGKKIWAGSVIKLPIEEAKNLMKNGIAERADEIG